ncbi:MAG: hypothetical protein JWP81_1216 [Ferruginibacter sp.]|nr:hypothetical protein [Ferruginibacter sp.]
MYRRPCFLSNYEELNPNYSFITRNTLHVNNLITYPIDKSKFRDMLLKALTISSGAIDAISFLALGKVFTAFMTGNIAFLGLTVAGNAAPPVISILASMIPFAIGVYITTRIIRSVKDSVSWPHQVTVALGISLIAQAAFLAIWFGVGGNPSTATIPYLLGFWAFAMGMQSSAVRTLHVDGVFTTAATATYIFLAGDISKWAATREERRRLAGVLLSLFAGATAGGWLLIHAHLYAPVLPFVVSGTVVIIAAIFLREPVKSNLLQV